MQSSAILITRKSGVLFSLRRLYGVKHVTGNSHKIPAGDRAGNHQNTPAAGNHPNTPAAGDQPNTHAAGDQPNTHAAGDHPTTPAAGEHPTTPSAGDHPTTPAAGDHPTTTAAGDHPTTPAAAEVNDGKDVTVTGEGAPNHNFTTAADSKRLKQLHITFAGLREKNGVQKVPTNTDESAHNHETTDVESQKESEKNGNGIEGDNGSIKDHKKENENGGSIWNHQLWDYVPSVSLVSLLGERSVSGFRAKLKDNKKYNVTEKDNITPPVRVVSEPNSYLVKFPMNRVLQVDYNIDEDRMIHVSGNCVDSGFEYQTSHQLPENIDVKKAKITTWKHDGDFCVQLTDFE